MEEPKETAGVDAIVATTEEVDELLRSTVSFQSIIFTTDATNDIVKITSLITKNQRTLRHLTLDRRHSSQEVVTVPWSQTKELGLALGGCQELRHLQIKKFQGSFNEAVKYLIVGIVRLTNLESLNLKETYLSPHLSLLLDGLSKLNHLRMLNLDCCSLISEWDFGTFLYQFSKENTSLQELDLGRSPIWLNAFLPILEGFKGTRNHQLKLKWCPPITYQENEILYQQLRMAVNWDNDTAVKKHCLSQIEVATTGTPCEVSVQQFTVSRQKLNELLMTLEQRQNPTKVTRLQFTVTSLTTDLALMLIRVSGCVDSLEVLEVAVECDPAPYLCWTEFDSKLATLLEKAIHLHTLKLFNFQHGLAKYQQTLKTLTTLPKLKTLVLSDTYLGQAGAKCLGEILRKKILIELDITNSGLVTDECFHSLITGFRDCTSLQKVELGQTPMMGVWLRMLVTSGRRNQPPEIVWQPSNLKDMSALFERMCKSLQSVDSNLTANTFVSKFITQDLELLKTQTAALLALKPKDNVVANAVRRGFLGRTPEPNIEMQRIKAVPKGYGTANGK